MRDTKRGRLTKLPLEIRDVRHKARFCAAIALALTLLPATTPADQLFVSVDVPATLSAADHLPNEVIERNDLSYSTEFSLGVSTQISALQLERDGSWLFSVLTPTQLGGQEYEPRDLIRTDAGVYSLVIDGAAAGVPAGVAIDAVMRDASGQIVLSFDVPVELDGGSYGRSDLVLYDGSFSLFWDATAAGVPGYANLVAASLNDAGDLTGSFDVPVLLAGTEHLPGEIVTLASGFMSYELDASWPAYATLGSLSFPPGIGPVPGAAGDGGPPLTLSANGDGSLHLEWAPSCGMSSDYAIYEGSLGDDGSHQPLICTTGRATAADIDPGPGGRYYLVVAHNGYREGSYGRTSAGAEREVSQGPCHEQALGTCY